MNVPEKLAKAVAKQDWQLVSEAHETLTGRPLDLPEDRNIGAEIIEGLEGYLDALKRGEAPQGTFVAKKQISAMKVGSHTKDVDQGIAYRETEEEPTTNYQHRKPKKKAKRKKKATQNTTTIDESLSDPVVDEADLYEPERGEHIEATRAGKVKVDKTKTELITCEVNEEERKQNKKEVTPRQRRKTYQELKYRCYRCSKEQKSPKRLSTEDIKNFVCDDCGKGVIRRS